MGSNSSCTGGWFFICAKKMLLLLGNDGGWLLLLWHFGASRRSIMFYLWDELTNKNWKCPTHISADMVSFPTLVSFHIKLFGKLNLNRLIVLVSQKVWLTGNNWFSKNREKNSPPVFLSPLLYSAPDLSVENSSSVTSLDITQMLPSALGALR